jgi:hypothetical protein
MVDYYVKCIREDADGNIDEVGYGSNIDKYVSDTKSKNAVIQDIDARNKTVKTAYYSDQQDQWVDGDDIHTVDGQYIRTDGNDIRADNLEHLGICPDSI